MTENKEIEQFISSLQAQIIAGRDGKPSHAVLPIETLMALITLVRGRASNKEEWGNLREKESNLSPEDKLLATLSGLPKDFYENGIPVTTLAKIITYGKTDKDVAAYDAAIEQNEESFPSEVADRLIAGDNPIKVFRKYRHMTQGDLASKVDTTAAYLSQIETGRRTGSVKLLSRLADTLAVEIDDLL